MAVQMAMPANDLAQVCAPAKTAMVSADGCAEFKNILQGMRESRQNMPKTAPKAGKEPKTPVNFAFLAGEEGERAANSDELAAACPAELEMTPDDESESPPPSSRFAPDVFLEAMEEAPADKRGTDLVKDAEACAPAPEDRTEDTEKDRETSAPVSGENEAQPLPAEINEPAALAEFVSFPETNALPQNDPPAEINGKTEADVKKLSDQPAERPVQTAGVQIGETDEPAAENASREPKSRESETTDAKEPPDTNINAKNTKNTENTDNAGRETYNGDEHDAGEKSEPRAPKTVSRAADTVHSAEDAVAGKAGKSSAEGASPEKPSAERAAEPQIFAANPSGGQTRAEITPLAQAPTVYTLMSADKFGEGLRSVMTIMTRDGGAEARIVVEPPALGRVDISLRASESGVEANFKVDSEELKQMVQKQLDSLKESLNAQGIHVSGMTVDIKNNEGERDRGNAGASKKGRRARLDAANDADEDIEDGTRVSRLDLEQGLLHWVA
jgi:flagellar hook-length control protein FliK